MGPTVGKMVGSLETDGKLDGFDDTLGAEETDGNADGFID